MAQETMLKIAFFGQSGPYAIPAVHSLLRSRAHGEAYQLSLVVEGVKARSPLGRYQHRLVAAKRRRVERGASVAAATAYDLAEFVSAAGVPCLQSKDVNHSGAQRLLGQFDIDVMVCVGFDRLFKPSLLRWPRLGGINAHPSALPLWRGPAPIFWARHAGERQQAVTLHRLDEQEDHGAIVELVSEELPDLCTGEQAFAVAGNLAGPCLVDVLRASAVAGRLPSGAAQRHGDASRAPRPRPEDVRVQAIGWSCRRLANFLCLAPFFRTPWAVLGDDTFFMRRAIGYHHGRRLPGQYLLQGDRLHLQCRDGVVEAEIQI